MTSALNTTGGSGILTKPTSKAPNRNGPYKDGIASDNVSDRQHGRADLIEKDYFKPQRKCRIRRLESSKSRTETKGVVKIWGVIPLVVHMGDQQVVT